MLVIGGGYIGLEMGSDWSRLGTKDTVIEKLDRILPSMDSEVASEFKKSLEKQGIEFKLSHKVTATKSSSKEVEVTIESEKDRNQTTRQFAQAAGVVGLRGDSCPVPPYELTGQCYALAL